jgi:hypothetical protein
LYSQLYALQFREEEDAAAATPDLQR